MFCSKNTKISYHIEVKKTTVHSHKRWFSAIRFMQFAILYLYSCYVKVNTLTENPSVKTANRRNAIREILPKSQQE